MGTQSKTKFQGVNWTKETDNRIEISNAILDFIEKENGDFERDQNTSTGNYLVDFVKGKGLVSINKTEVEAKVLAQTAKQQNRKYYNATDKASLVAWLQKEFK